jgi:hypothetical protein
MWGHEMSIILVLANGFFMKMMSDKRVCDEITGIPIDENYPKVMQLNKNVCVGFGGSQKFCEHTIQALTQRDKLHLSLADTIKILHDRAVYLNRSNGFVYKDIIMTICGITDSGDIELDFFGSKYGFEINRRIPPQLPSCCMLELRSASVETNGGFKDFFMSRNPEGIFTYYDRLMREYIELVSRTDAFVNNSVCSVGVSKI